jgi:radical SAM superfamily enzyme YgiQ (UPF0313 family)
MNDTKKKIQLLLINPWIYDFTAYDFWSKPLGLLYIASILRNIGYQIDYLDCMDRFEPGLLELPNYLFSKNNPDGRGPFYKERTAKPELLKHIPRNYSRYGITEEIFLKKLKQLSRPDVVLVTSIMTYWYPGVFKVIELIKEYYPDCPVILGGIYATLCYSHAVNFSGADYVLKNFQVATLLELLYSIVGIPIPPGQNLLNSTSLKQLDCYPYPAWDLYPKLDYVCLITSRGCPFNCSYCASYIINPVLEFRKPNHIIEEITYWVRQKGINNFVFYDDALLVNAESHFIPLLQELKKKNLNINFYTPNALHAKLITKPIAQLMAENGFKRIWLGFETSDPDLQRKTGNKIDNSIFQKSVKILLEAGFSPEQVRAYLLVGLPEQSFKSILGSINFVLDTGIKPYLAKFSPIPGTKIWKQFIDEYKWPEPVDPLWHNDALLPYYSNSINYEQYQQLKMLIQNFKL